MGPCYPFAAYQARSVILRDFDFTACCNYENYALRSRSLNVLLKRINKPGVSFTFSSGG